jgi:LPXTG-motif cell wall-anchored protein
MNKGRLIGGIICLALAALLAVLNLTLPSDEVVFMVGDTNAPLVPVIGLAVVGVALLATARKRAER